MKTEKAPTALLGESFIKRLINLIRVQASTWGLMIVYITLSLFEQ
ncbi:MAG: hypothetical protein ACI9TI_000267 [Natronomonas sp.]|jgi:hypothetical protein